MLSDWKGRLQSLQYREQDAGFRNLCALAARPIKTSLIINQIESLDDFAHQIAGLRGVLTISNTTAHMALREPYHPLLSPHPLDSTGGWHLA